MWNTLASRATAMHGTCVSVIPQQLPYKNMSNSVHNCESNTRSTLINSRINYQGYTLIAHICKEYFMALIIVMYTYKQSGNKGDLRSKKGS